MTLTPDQFMAALCLWREARGQSLAAKAAVYNVILNRSTDPKGRWPKTPWGVVLQPFQFSSFNQGEVNSTKFPVESNKADWNAWLDCLSVVAAPIGGDSTQGANFYHDSSIEPPAKAWLGGAATKDDLLAKLTCKIGAFSFYRL